MNLSEIENLSFADLKAKREELVKAIGCGELAERYVQARTDAKMRDEKLSEQGKTIEALQAGTTALTEKSNDLESQRQVAIDRCKRLEETLERRMSEAQEELDKRAAAIDQANAACSAETKRANAAESLAKSRRKALAEVTGICNPLLAAE